MSAVPLQVSYRNTAALVLPREPPRNSEPRGPCSQNLSVRVEVFSEAKEGLILARRVIDLEDNQITTASSGSIYKGYPPCLILPGEPIGSINPPTPSPRPAPLIAPCP